MLVRQTRARNARAGERHGIQSVDRAVTLLEALAEAGGEATLTDIASRAGLNISTSHHLLSTLVHRGYVAKVAGRRSYALGPRIHFLGDACMREISLPQRAEPFIARVNQATGETVHLVALRGEAMMTLARREALHGGPSAVSGADGAHARASGKAMLAWLPEHEIQRIINAHGMMKFTPNTITDWPVLNEELRLVRRNSYSMDREEYQAGLCCVGSAIRDQKGTVVASLAVSTSAARATTEHLALIRHEVITAARALSAELRDPPPLAPAADPRAS
jgi:IclR family acetate operon transcriptional repressor